MITREEDAQMRSIGRRALESTRKRQQEQFSRDYMAVTAVNGSLLDVSAGDAETPLAISDVPMTTACVGVKVGDIVVVDIYRHKPIAVGIVAGDA